MDATAQTLVNVIIALVGIGASVLLSIRFGDMAAARHSEKVARQMEAERLHREQLQLYLLLNQLLEVQTGVADELSRHVRNADERYRFPRPSEAFDADALRSLTASHVLGADPEELRSLIRLVAQLTQVNHRLYELPGEASFRPALREEALSLLVESSNRIDQVGKWVRPRLTALQSAPPVPPPPLRKEMVS
jgi:hypothetical protein